MDVYALLQAALRDMSGIHLHEGKTRVWNKAGLEPAGIDALGDGVWDPEGVKVLGTPVGSDAFVSNHSKERMSEEDAFLGGIPHIPLGARGSSSCFAQGHNPTT